MPRNFDVRLDWKDRRTRMRVALGLLLAANVTAALVLFKPWGGSASDLVRLLEQRRREVALQDARGERTRVVAANVEKGRTAGDQFLEEYTLDRRKAFSTLIADVDSMAQKAGLKSKGSSWVLEPVEGSDDALGQLTISVNYEGSYTSLTQFVRALDKSNRFLIIQGLQASPQPSGTLNVNLKLDTFIRQPGGAS